MTKFFEQFNDITDGKFNMLKLNSALYVQSKRELTVRFIVSALEIASLTDKIKGEIFAVVQDMFDGIKVNVEYIRTFADDNIVKNRVMEYLNQHNQFLFKNISQKNIDISVGDKDIYIKFNFDTPTYHLISTGDLISNLTEFLDRNFTQTIEIECEENLTKFVPSVEVDDFDDGSSEDMQLRLIKCVPLQKIFGLSRIDGIGRLPGYIADAKTSSDNAVLCGKISNIAKRNYANKKYDPNNPKFGPETKTLFNFIIDDTTSKMDCVCFPSEKDVVKIENIEENSTVVLTGRLAMDGYKKKLGLTANAIFSADIDFGSIQVAKSKPVAKNYYVVFPEPYTEMAQDSIFETAGEVVDDLFSGKTYVIYDFEATDKFIETAEPIEIACLKIENGKATQSFQSLIKPTLEISDFITGLTHINNEMVANSPSIEEVLPDFYKFSKGAILVGHNIAGYDYPLLSKYGDKLGYNFDNELFDTLIQSRKYLTEFKSFKLESLSKNLNLTHENAHRAMSDVEATFGLMRALAKRM